MNDLLRQEIQRTARRLLDGETVNIDGYEVMVADYGDQVDPCYLCAFRHHCSTSSNTLSTFYVCAEIDFIAGPGHILLKKV